MAIPTLFLEGTVDWDKMDLGNEKTISWKELHENFPWACHLADGGSKKVFRVYNQQEEEEEACAIM
jgi:hypothetical protein